MPTVVDIPGVGEVEFPDTMKQPEIDAAAKKLYDESGKPGPAMRYLKSAAKQMNPVAMAKGFAQMMANPIDTIKQMGAAQGKLLQEAGEKIGAGDHLGGAARLLAYMTPLFGPVVAEAQDQIQSGDVAGGLGTMTGVAATLAGPSAVKALAPRVGAALAPAGEAVAGRLYRSAMKPSTALSAERSAAAVQTGLKEGIPVSAAGVEKLSTLVDDLNTKIAAVIAKDPKRPISIKKAVQNTVELEQRLGQQVNPASDVRAVANSRQELVDRVTTGKGVRDLTAEEAQAIKQGTYSSLKKNYGELKSASVESQKAMARGLKDEIADQFPELKTLNARESKLLALEPLLERAVNRISNHSIIGIGTPIAGAAMKVVTKSSGAAAGVGFLKAILDNPSVKSRLAIALSRSGVPLKTAKLRVAAYAAALGNAVESAQPPADQDAQ